MDANPPKEGAEASKGAKIIPDASSDAVREKPDDGGGRGVGVGVGTKTSGVVIIEDPKNASDDATPTHAGDKVDGGSRNINAQTDPRMTSGDCAQNGFEVKRGESSAGNGSISGEQHSLYAKHIPVSTNHTDSKDDMSVGKGEGDNDMMDVEGKTDERATTTSKSVAPDSIAAKEAGAIAESDGAGEAATSDRWAVKVPSVTAEEETSGPVSRSDHAWDDFDPEECFICFDGGEILLCDYCNRSYHLQCHRPPLEKVPEGKFKCMECVALSNWGVGSAPSTTGGGTSGRGKKRAQKDNAPDCVDPSEAIKYIGARVAKKFDGEVYFGSVTQYNEKTQFWHVIYDDNDEEDYDSNDMEEAGILYRKERKGDDPKKSRGSQQRYFRRDKPRKEPSPPKKKKVDKPKHARPNKKAKQDSSASSPSRPPPSRSHSPIVERLPPRYCIIQVPQEAKSGDIIDVVFPGDEFTSQIVCPDFVQRSPFVTVVAPGGYRPPSAPIDYARTNADRLCYGLPTDKTRPFAVETFNYTLWPALKADGWKRVDVQETGTGSTQFIPPGNRYSLSDSAGRLGLGFCTSYHGVISFCADADEYKELHATFEADCVARKEKAERLKQMERDMLYLSSKQHDTPIGPDHQVSDLPIPRSSDVYLCENQGSLRAERCRISWSPKFVNIATNDFLKKLSTENRAEYDIEAAMEIFWSYDYNDIAARAVITMPVPPDESWKIGVNEKDFEAKLKASNHDLKKVANALGINLIKCLWYYYHCYRPCRQWDFERDKDTFHDALLNARGNLRKAATILGKRYDSCLWFYDSKYRFSISHQKYKKEENRIIEQGEYCALCEETGEDLLPCSSCPKSYHTSCVSLEEADIPEGDWICPACNPAGFPCPHCSKSFRKEGGLSNHLRHCGASQSSDSDSSSNTDEKQLDDISAHTSSNSEAEKEEPAPSGISTPQISSLPVSNNSAQTSTTVVSTSAVLNPSTRPPGRFPIPPVHSSIPRSSSPKEVEAIVPATMTRLRLFPSVSDAARMSNVNRTTLAKICKEGGGIMEGIFYRFTTDEPNPSQDGLQNRSIGSAGDATSKDLVNRMEKEWASKEAKIQAAQAGRALALIEEQKRRLKEQQTEPRHISDRTEDNAPDALVQIMPAVSSQNSATTSAEPAAESSAQAAAAAVDTVDTSDAGKSPNEGEDSSGENDVLI